MFTHNYTSRKEMRMKSRFSKLIVLLSVLTLISYTVAVFVLIIEGYHVPDSLTYSFFGAFTVELTALAGIKIKDKNNIPDKHKDIV